MDLNMILLSFIILVVSESLPCSARPQYVTYCNPPCCCQPCAPLTTWGQAPVNLIAKTGYESKGPPSSPQTPPQSPPTPSQPPQTPPPQTPPPQPRKGSQRGSLFQSLFAMPRSLADSVLNGGMHMNDF